MKIITLPDELNFENAPAVQVFDYQSSQEISRQQIILNQNAFSFLLEGHKEVVFNNSILSIDNSRFLVMKSGHCLMTEKLSEIKNYRSILLFFTNEILLKFIRKTVLKRNISSVCKSVHSFKYDEFIKRFVLSLSDISVLSKNVQTNMLYIKFEEIMLYLTEIYGTGFLYSLLKNSDDATQRFRRTVESNQLSKLTLKELAFLCNMSISTFKREFEKHYATSPIKWFQNKRLEHAHYLMNKEQKSSSDIYLEIGYENLSSFIKAYKSKYGMTPKQHHKN
ncbi:AraC-like DNA-binding protein [Chryseobacterium sp. SORGH_AS 447]|uniref:helix-turn-helix domain-containing protein n=1 Tax=Chryseobacterium sp. SORGH_AS_0447 TaxID=3041769 RepID=UPI002783F4C3|nr:AraC family transcriptional regulator [Chryseobacterium sp. SORGH_AS_0447]MDQ1161760.1 AraC-like DNA-binding protein [Chryseobacterium sp. SORGH_AS_0447]